MVELFKFATIGQRREHGLLAMSNEAFDVHFNPSAFLLPNTPSNAGACHNIPGQLFSARFYS